MVLGELDSNIRKNVTGPLSYTIPKISSRWIKDLNVKQETIKTLEDKTGNNLFDLSCSNFLLNMSLKAREIEAKMHYWDLIKIKSFCIEKETIRKTISSCVTFARNLLFKILLFISKVNICLLLKMSKIQESRVSQMQL